MPWNRLGAGRNAGIRAELGRRWWLAVQTVDDPDVSLWQPEISTPERKDQV